jgi:hypothetical protein
MYKGPANRCGGVDIHELLKGEIYKQGGLDTGYRFGQAAGGSIGPGSAAPSVTGFEDYELYFDSVNKDGSSDLVNGELKFSITDLNNNQDIHSCIEMKVGSFYFPKVINPAGSPDFYFYRRVYLQVLGLPSTQGVLADNGNQYHFEFSVENFSGIAVLLVPIKDTFFFQRPITSLTDLQLRFTVPIFKRIPLPEVILNVVSIAGSNPAQFSIVGGPTTAAIGDIGLLPAPGVAVYISGFASGDPAVNIATNNTAGVFVTTVVNATQIIIASLNFATVGVVVAQMIVAKNRIAIPIRFTSIKDSVTNYINVVHE